MKKAKQYVLFGRSTIGRLRILAYKTRHSQLIKVLVAIFFVAILAAIGVTLLESQSNAQFKNLSNGLWWAVVTMATVGYGDIVPITPAGRLVAGIVIMSGVTLFSVFTAAVSSRVITNRLKEGKGLSKSSAKNHIAILGWNPSGENIIEAIRDEAIRENRSIVLVNRMNPDDAAQVINKYRDLHIQFVYGDFGDETVLSRANIKSAYAAVILPDESDGSKPKSDERTILGTLSVKAIEPRVKVIAHIIDPLNEAHIRRANADQVVVSDRYSGYLLGAHVVAPGIPELVDILLKGNRGVRLARRKIPHVVSGKTFSDLASYFKRENEAMLIGIIKEEAGFKLDDILSDDYTSIDHFIRVKLEAAGKGLSKKSRVDVEINPPADYKVSDKDIAVVIERV